MANADAENFDGEMSLNVENMVIEQEPINAEYKTGNQLGSLDDSVSAMQYRQGKLYSTTFCGEVVTFDPTSGDPLDKFVCRNDNKPMMISCLDVEGTKCAVGSATGEIGLYDLEKKEAVLPLWRDHDAKTTNVKLFDNLLYSTGQDGYFYIRNIEYDKLVNSFISCTCPLSSIVTEGPNVVYLGAWDGCVKKVDLRAKTCVQVIEAEADENSPVRALCIAPQPPPPATTAKGKAGKKGKDTYDPDNPPMLLFCAHGIGKIKCWDLRMDVPLMESYTGHTDVINVLNVHNNVLYSGGDDRTVRLFDVAKGICLDTLSGHTNGITSMCINRDSLFTGSFDRTIREYSVPNIETAMTQKLLKAEQRKKEAYENWLANKDKKKKGKKKGSKKKGGKKGGSKKKGSKKKKK